MKNQKYIQSEANRIIKELLRIDKEKILIKKYMHEIVYDMVKNKKMYHDILYEVVNLIPIGLSITTEPYFKFETHEEFIKNRTKYEQLNIFEK